MKLLVAITFELRTPWHKLSRPPGRQCNKLACSVPPDATPPGTAPNPTASTSCQSSRCPGSAPTGGMQLWIHDLARAPRHWPAAPHWKQTVFIWSQKAYLLIAYLFKVHSFTDPSAAQDARSHTRSPSLRVAWGWKIIAPTLQSWPLKVKTGSQLGTDQSLQSPLLENFTI